MKKILKTFYLRLDLSTKSLIKRALADLILKTVYVLGDSQEKSAIITNIKSILGTVISGIKVDEAIKLLTAEGALTESQSRYSVAEDRKVNIANATTEFTNRQNRIINKFFGNTISARGDIALWFENVTVEFFKEYGDEWISDLCRVTDGAVKGKHLGIRLILDKLTDKNKKIQAKDVEGLKKQYINFITSSTDPDVYSILWDYGTSGFSSSLITANISADPFTIDEFRDTKCILDTNILMYLDLESSEFKESFTSMEKIFQKLNISPIYFYITRDEFLSSMERKRDAILHVIKRYPLEVTSKLHEPFITTAIKRGCVTIDDFELFFNELMDIPKYFSESLEIAQVDDPELDDAIEKGKKDENLKEKLNKIYRSKKNKDKNKLLLQHDAGLIAGAKHTRLTDKCFILSRDSSINEVALDSPSLNEMPISIGMDTLINILAIDNGGTDIDPLNYAPLFANIIKLAMIPEHDTFKVEDLSRMLDVQAQIADLPSERIIDIAKELHHNQIMGVPEEEISLRLARRFQAAKLELKSDLDMFRKQVLFEKTEKEKFLMRSDKAVNKLREKIIGELRDKYDGQLLRNRIIIFAILPLLTILITGVYLYFESSNNFSWKDQLQGFALNVIVWLLTDFLFINKKIRGKYSERVNSIIEEAERKITETIET